MFKFVKIAIVAGVLATLTACTGHIETKKTTAATIICCTLQFLFLKLLVVAARLPINNRNDCADTKKPGFSRFFYRSDKRYGADALSNLRSFVGPISSRHRASNNCYGFATKPMAS
ncbi:outer membrane lipoprotein [Salmonella enterica subsp. enterica]|nr:outer membrane lipoprotein [Salmonella enterica subsp. enterica]